MDSYSYKNAAILQEWFEEDDYDFQVFAEHLFDVLEKQAWFIEGSPQHLWDLQDWYLWRTVYVSTGTSCFHSTRLPQTNLGRCFCVCSVGKCIFQKRWMNECKNVISWSEYHFLIKPETAKA